MYSYIGKTVRAIGNYPIAWDVINEYVSDKKNEQFKISPWSQIPDFGC
jgi:GH35 family endo-1,4-beta-xylanase